MDEEFAEIFGIIWDKIYEALGNDDFKINTNWLQFFIGGI